MARIALWDLDKTLGTFDSLEQGRTDIQLRPGIKQILEDNQQKGIINVITTNATREYAEQALLLAEIKKYFELVFSREVVMAYAGKKYQDILTIYGISGDEAKDKVIVIGDTPRDRPVDVPGLTFVLDSTYRNEGSNAQDLRQILNDLTAHKSFAKGFEAMYSQAELHQDGYKVLQNGFDARCALNRGGDPAINLIMLSK